MVFVDDPLRPVLTSADAHHLLDVLRLRSGESVIAADGAGSWLPCRLAAPAREEPAAGDLASLLRPDGDLIRQPRTEPVITVAFAPTKGDRPEWVTQKLTELGVDRIVPLRTARSVVRWEGERAGRAVERLRRVAREASAQCRRPWLPEVAPVSTVGELALLAGAPPTLAHLGGDLPSLDRPVVAVGPEGGWDEDELTGGQARLGLGPTVLRAETAAVAAGTVLCALRGGLVGTLA
jgi:16S rRNA (uracil1498-N3)-methyltransferase